MTGDRRIPNPIAVRRFTVVGEPDREVVLSLGKPRPDPKQPGRFRCSFLLLGAPNEGRFRVTGADAIHALQLALDGARRAIDASGLPLTWVDEGEPGDLGLPLSAPIGFGLSFQRRVEQSIERETGEMAGALTTVLRERARRRAARERG